MDRFLCELAAIPRLDAAAERELAVRARDGDEQARAELITASLSLVVMRAKRWGLRGSQLMDAIQAGSIGLIEAIDRFDPDRGCRLSTYAWWWIGHAMAEGLDRPDRPAEFELPAEEPVAPTGLGGVLDELSEEQTQVLVCRFETVATTGRPRPRIDVARRLGLSVSQVRSREAKAMQHVRRRLAKVGDRAPHEHRGADPL